MNFRMKNWAVLALALILISSLVADEALAQRRGGSSSTTTTTTTSAPAKKRPPIELSATYGSMWGGNIEFLYGKLRTGTGPSLGIALDVPMNPAMALELIYTRQDGSIDWEHNGGGGTETLSDMSVNYWQIGAIRGLIDGAVRPFVSMGIGATYYSPSETTVTINDEVYNIDSSTKLSFALGVGVKSYFGDAQRFGLRGSFKVLPTLYNSSGGVWIGTGGASLGISGNAIWQWEAAIGLTVKLGG